MGTEWLPNEGASSALHRSISEAVQFLWPEIATLSCEHEILWVAGSAPNPKLDVLARLMVTHSVQHVLIGADLPAIHRQDHVGMAQTGKLGVAPGSWRPHHDALRGYSQTRYVRVNVDMPADADPRTA